MDGSQPLGKRPVSPPQPDQQPISTNSAGGVAAREGKAHIPSAPPATPTTPLGARTASALENVEPKVISDKLIEKYSTDYSEHHAKAEAIQAKLDLADSVATIKHLLENPAEAKKNSSFVILWVPDDGGESISVIPPDDKMNQQKQLATELKTNLSEQLSKFESNYTPGKIAELKEDKAHHLDLRDLAKARLEKAGAPLPRLEAPTRVAVIGNSHISATPAPKTAAPAQKTETPLKESNHPKKPEVRTEPPQTDSIPVKTAPSRQADIPPAQLGGKFIFKVKPATQQEASSAKPLPEDDKKPASEPAQKHEAYKHPESIVRSRPKPLSSDRTAAPALPTMNRPTTVVEYSVLGPGKNGTHADIFDSATALASVNAGDVNLYVGGGGINRQFGNELEKSGHKIGKYEELHKGLLQSYNPGKAVTIEHVADGDYPEIQSSTLFRSTHSALKSPYGTVILHVFRKGHYPHDNPDNKAMIYIVPPDGRKGASENEFKQAVTETAANIINAVNAYNTEAKKKGLKTIETVRVCGFSSDSYRHPKVAASEVGQCIDNGVRRAMEDYQNSPGTDLSIKKVEYANGSGEVFSQLDAKQPITAQPSVDDLLSIPDEATVDEEFSLFAQKRSESSKPPLQPEATVPSKEPLAAQPKTDFEQAPALNQIEKGSELKKQSSRSDRQAFGSKQYPTQEMDLNVPGFLNGIGASKLVNSGSTSLTEALKASPANIAAEFEKDKMRHARQALAHIPSQQQALTNPFISADPDYGKQHVSRKALLTRTLVNFHRKHSMSDGSMYREAREISNNAIPLIEMAVLRTPARTSNMTDQLSGAQSTRAAFKKLGITSEPLTTKITNATNEVVVGSPNLLDDIVADAKKIEGMRLEKEFDCTQLKCFSRYGEQAQVELVKLCLEYRDFLIKQKALKCTSDTQTLTLSAISEQGSLIDDAEKTKPASFDQAAISELESSNSVFESAHQQFIKQPLLGELYQYKLTP